MNNEQSAAMFGNTHENGGYKGILWSLFVFYNDNYCPIERGYNDVSESIESFVWKMGSCNA